MSNTTDETTSPEASCAPPFGSAILLAWADKCGIEVDDERVIYGWPDKFKVFKAGWDAKEKDFAANLRLAIEKFRTESEFLKDQAGQRALGGALVYEDVAEMLEKLFLPNTVVKQPETPTKTT